MFDDRDNIIGVLLLALCVAVGGVMVYAIATGTKFEYTGPRWLSVFLAVVFIGGILYGMWGSISGRMKSGGSEQWPSPGAGRRPWWKFWGR